MTRFFILVVLLVFGLFGQANAQTGHSHDPAPTTSLKLNKGKKWETDASLRKGMESIKAQMQKDLEAIHANSLRPDAYKQLAATLTKEINFIFKECKLSPEADAMLHVLLSKVMAGTEEMKSGRRSGAIAVVMALDEYPKYFNHPNWKPLKH